MTLGEAKTKRKRYVPPSLSDVDSVAIYGGATSLSVGNRHEMQFFFECIQYYTSKFDATTDYSLILDRLYKRYLRLEELAPALGSIKKFIKDQRDHDKNPFNLKATNLESFFDKHLSVAEKAIINAKKMYEIYQKKGEDFYQRVMITKFHPV